MNHFKIDDTAAKTMNISTEELIRQHTSVRYFSDAPVDSNLLFSILECGQMAPSSSFIQSYSIIRVNNKEHRKKIAHAAGGQSWVEKAPEFLIFCADLTRVEHACMKHGGENLEGHTEHFIAATVDVALVAQNILTVAESKGLGGVFIGGIRNNPELLSEILNLPDQVYPIFGFCLGWPASQGQLKPRLPLSAILHEESYNNEFLDQHIDTYDKLMTGYYSSRSYNQKNSNWSKETAKSMYKKRREHMLNFLQSQGLLKR